MHLRKQISLQCRIVFAQRLINRKKKQSLNHHQKSLIYCGHDSRTSMTSQEHQMYCSRTSRVECLMKQNALQNGVKLVFIFLDWLPNKIIELSVPRYLPGAGEKRLDEFLLFFKAYLFVNECSELHQKSDLRSSQSERLSIAPSNTHA